MKSLYLPVKAIYFEQIKAGTKTQEFRLLTPFWRKRLEGKTFDFVVVTKGYPARLDAARRLTFPWAGYELKTILHEHFGPVAVEVFAINLGVSS